MGFPSLSSQQSLVNEKFGLMEIPWRSHQSLMKSGSHGSLMEIPWYQVSMEVSSRSHGFGKYPQRETSSNPNPNWNCIEVSRKSHENF